MTYRGLHAVVLALVVVLAGCSTGGGPSDDGGDGGTPTVTMTPAPTATAPPSPTPAAPAVSDPETATPTATATATPPGDPPAPTTEPWFDMRRTSHYEFRVAIDGEVQHITLDVTRENELVTAYEVRIEEEDGDVTVATGEAAATLPNELDMFRTMQVQEGPMPRNVVVLSVTAPLALMKVGDYPALDGSLTPGQRGGSFPDGTDYYGTIQQPTSYGGVECVDASFVTATIDRFDTCLTGTGYAPYVSVDTPDGRIRAELLSYSHEE